MSRSHRLVLVAVAGVASACPGSDAWALDGTQVVQQVLDRVVVHNRADGLDMNFKEPDVLSGQVPDFLPFGLGSEVGLRSCQLTGNRGLYCLDGFEVVRWQAPEDGGLGEEQFSCDNRVLDLDTRRVDTCSAMAVAQNGDIWLSGRRGSAYVLFKLWQRGPDEDCSILADIPPDRDPRVEADETQFCVAEYATGRPLLLKLVAVEGDEREAFEARGANLSTDGTAVLGLDERNAVTAFGPAQFQVNDLAVGKTTWTLNGSERLIDLDLLQLPNGSTTGDTVDNHLVVTTSNGRVLTRTTDDGTSLFTSDAFDIVADRGSALRPATCPVAAQGFGVVASTKSGRVYVTDRSYCRTVALRAPAPNATTAFCGFVNVDSTSPSGELVCPVSGGLVDPSEPLTLSTGSNAPDGATLAPGITINLVECERNGTCTLIPGTDPNRPFAKLENVLLNSESSDEPARMVLFQVKNIPDCRYIPNDEACVPEAVYPPYPVPGPDQNGVVPPVVPVDPETRYLNVTELLPSDVTDQFAAQGGLPPLLISPRYRARDDQPQPYTFGALFGIPEDGVYFRDMFDGYFDVGALVGTGTDPTRCYRQAGQDSAAELVDWDVVTYVSERYISVGGPNGLFDPDGYDHVDTLTNTGCGSTKSGVVNWSMISYGLEMAHAAGAVDPELFVKLLEDLFADLVQTQNELACGVGVDSDVSNPLGGPAGSVCTSLRSELESLQFKLDKCIQATRDPKSSATNENCQSFLTRMRQYVRTVDALPPASPAHLDPANRIGGLEARALTILWVYEDRFLPSIPSGGFQ
jgi:hypothetical protein